MSDSLKLSAADRQDLLGRCNFPEPGIAVTCAVSGGADSLALLILAVAAGLDVTAAHVDHGLRAGSESEAALVAHEAARCGASFRSEAVEVAPGPNVEERARIERYRVLPDDVMTGHTADDRAETVLLNLLRGAGPSGMSALRPSQRRPLLNLRRVETERVCRNAGVEPFEDPSNADPRFRRNRVRHELLPLLGDISERDPVPLLVRQADLFAEMADTLSELASGLDVTDSRALRVAPRPVAAQALREWLVDSLGHVPDRAAIERVMRVVDLEIRATEIGGGRRIERHQGRLTLLDAGSPLDTSAHPTDGG